MERVRDMKKKWIAIGTTLLVTAAMAMPVMAAIDFETAKIRPDYTVVIDGQEKNLKRADTFKNKNKDKEKPAGKDIGLEKVKKIALQHAGLKASEVSRLRAEKDYDDGKIKYDVEFQLGRMEYDYEIHAETGIILKSEKDFDD